MDLRRCLRSCFCDCVCARWPCWEHWRAWCKPLMVIIYLMVLFVMLPLLIYGLYREHAQAQFKVWFVAGIFLLLTLPIFLLGLMQHLFNYTQPHLQKHIIRFEPSPVPCSSLVGHHPSIYEERINPFLFCVLRSFQCVCGFSMLLK